LLKRPSLQQGLSALSLGQYIRARGKKRQSKKEDKGLGRHVAMYRLGSTTRAPKGHQPVKPSDLKGSQCHEIRPALRPHPRNLVRSANPQLLKAPNVRPILSTLIFQPTRPACYPMENQITTGTPQSRHACLACRQSKRRCDRISSGCTLCFELVSHRASWLHHMHANGYNS
jgi:hypothetical protein